ncbi:hypothetical protein ACFQ4C_07065 [Larkinella insperata]|uniref:Uncharacterized protein n=1 Tax=Larkinella insperata TaxID=332158 RepID=A0ABW3Q6M3_9BACT
MKVNSFIVVKKNYKNSQFRAQIVELCRSGIFSDQQLLDQLKISRGGGPSELHLGTGTATTSGIGKPAGFALDLLLP